MILKSIVLNYGLSDDIRNEAEFGRLGAFEYYILWENPNNPIEEYDKIGSIWLMRDNRTDVVKKDNNTGVELQTTSDIVSPDTYLIVAKITDEDTFKKIEDVLKENSNKFIVLDIKLMKNGSSIQPNGEVKISIPIPDGFDKNNLEVYRIEENGTKTNYGVTVEGNYATFKTDHFSNYVLAEVNSKSLKGAKDVTPKTGTMDEIYYLLPVMIISFIGIMVYYKRKNS